MPKNRLDKATDNMVALMTEFIEKAELSKTNERGSKKARKVLRKITTAIKNEGVEYRAASVEFDK
jgi:hypothetical protein